MSIHITAETFEEQVIKSEKPVLVDFYAVWCGPCQMLAPVIEELENSRDDFLAVKIDVDQEPALAQRFSITAVPTLLLFRNGENVKRVSGFLSKEALEQFIDEV
ncbi:MAG: thioredoxin [Lachnospiraceae bacterium]|jgi:thioredoxin 1|nr:thioredoxin [Lachnospiraceae bacterium]MCI9099451.1 thioredoxin [Lachnospiraceae bacterium]